MSTGLISRHSHHVGDDYGTQDLPCDYCTRVSTTLSSGDPLYRTLSVGAAVAKKSIVRGSTQNLVIPIALIYVHL